MLEGYGPGGMNMEQGQEQKPEGRRQGPGTRRHWAGGRGHWLEGKGLGQWPEYKLKGQGLKDKLGQGGRDPRAGN